jgi:hypothetical protein
VLKVKPPEKKERPTERPRNTKAWLFRASSQVVSFGLAMKSSIRNIVLVFGLLWVIGAILTRFDKSSTDSSKPARSEMTDPHLRQQSFEQGKVHAIEIIRRDYYPSQKVRINLGLDWRAFRFNDHPTCNQSSQECWMVLALGAPFGEAHWIVDLYTDKSWPVNDEARAYFVSRKGVFPRSGGLNVP